MPLFLPQPLLALLNPAGQPPFPLMALIRTSFQHQRPLNRLYIVVKWTADSKLGRVAQYSQRGLMALEKRQVFPNLFRYVCDSCPFDWPRTPVKESDLPPPPAHSCPTDNRPDPETDLKPVPEEQKREKDQKRETVESTKPKPVAVCTRCGAVSYTANLINGQCGQTVAGKRCVGVNGSALNPDDWKQCAACAGTGSVEETRCGHCDGTGWLYARSKAKR
jgi:hypothetical protein